MAAKGLVGQGHRHNFAERVIHHALDFSGLPFLRLCLLGLGRREQFGG
jgi:hypothetical protein